MGQFTALLYKNWLLYKRGIVGNVLYIVLPIAFICFYILVRKLATVTNYTYQSFIDVTNPNHTTLYFPLYGTQQYSNANNVQFRIKYCPNGQKIALVPTGDPFLLKVYNYFISANMKYQYFDTYASFYSYVRSLSYGTSTNICYAIVMVSGYPNYKYKIRTNSTKDLGDNGVYTADLTLQTALNLKQYQTQINSGMVGTNTFMNNLILQYRTITTNVFLVNVVPIYQYAYVDDPIYTYLGNSIGIISLLPLLILYLRMTASMLAEKENKIRYSMSIMGMTTFNYYFTWFIRYFVVLVVVHVACSFIISSALSYVPFYVPLVTFLLFDVLIIIQNFFIQIFFTRSKIGVVIALLFFVLQYVISFLVSSNTATQDVLTKASIIPHAAFVIAFQTMLYGNSIQYPITFKDVIGSYTIVTALVSFAINIGVYLVLLWYLDQVVPNYWGAKKHPLFCCVKYSKVYSEELTPYSQELGSSGTAAIGKRINNSNVSDGVKSPKKVNQSEDYFGDYVYSVDDKCRNLERENKIIKITKLRKYFGPYLVAVNDLSLKMYNNQIFTLLGHNGAGKTTTISMLTGMLAPSSGSIEVFGYTELSKIREMLGVCPQHDTLYEDLTVEEHLYLFATFKGLVGDYCDREVDTLIADVNLSEKRTEYSKNLSGGQKRRLSVAMAFAGRAKVIILDEPTSGMDTSARRYIWYLLKNYKYDRIIILTTHFMDEADFLGDRIAIMGAGKLLCCGSSLYLKNKFGVGYNITFVKTDQQDSSPIIKMVMKHVPTAKVLSNVSAELSMQLPLNYLPHFAKMFNEIDYNKVKLRIAYYGISITTLEYVFLKVGENLLAYQQQYQQQHNNLPITQQYPKTKPISPIDYQLLYYYLDNIYLVTGCYQFFKHFGATMLKRFRVIRRDLKSFVFYLILPLIIIVLALLLMRVSFIKDYPSTDINIDLYLTEQNPVTYPIGSSDATLRGNVKNALLKSYGAKINIKEDTTDNSALNFDKNYLFPIKQGQKTLKGGAYFEPIGAPTGSGNTLHQYTAVVNTRSPTSFYSIQTVAAQAYINYLTNDNITITMTNYPMPKTYNQLQVNNAISGFFAAFIFSIALAFKFASIISFVVKYRTDRSKHQQIVSGMRLSAYWLANFVYDYLLYALIAIIAALLCTAMKIDALTTGSALTATWLLFMLYGLAYIPFSYICSFIFIEYGNAQAGYYFFTFIMGGMLPILTLLLRILGSDTNAVGRGIAWVLRLFPSFAFGYALLNLGSLQFISLIYANNVLLDALSLDISLGSIIYLGFCTVLYLVVLFLMEFALNSYSFMRMFSSENSVMETTVVTDGDVLKEIEKAEKAEPEEYEILTKRLRKVYMIDGAAKHKVAVDNLSFCIEKGEVFGLLGVNGAGKTTTFKILAGYVTSTSGDSYFGGMKISYNIDKVRQSLGYCPQFDALIDNLTVRYQLEMFYDLKSLPSANKYQAVTKKIREMDLEEYEEKLSGTLSGGNKRKLSVATAMIGNPSIVFLDEPSTGMDPKARRFMWKIISRVATYKKQSTVILTTHSMYYAEALSTRLGIMVKGNFKCIGTPQHIKNRYGEGFEVEIKMNSIPRATIDAIIVEKLKGVRNVRRGELPIVLKSLNADPLDAQELAIGRNGGYIVSNMSETKMSEVFPVVYFIEISKQLRNIQGAIAAAIGQTEVLYSLQNFLRVKTVAKVSVGKFFEFFETNKQRLGIQQYTIKQATVEQIFNRFAYGNELSYYNQ